jgi:hypothetical protein
MTPVQRLNVAYTCILVSRRHEDKDSKKRAQVAPESNLGPFEQNKRAKHKVNHFYWASRSCEDWGGCDWFYGEGVIWQTYDTDVKVKSGA